MGCRDRVFTGQAATPGHHRGDHAGLEEVEEGVGRLRVDATEHGCSTGTVEGDDVEADGFAAGDGLFGEVEVGRQVPEGASDGRGCGGRVHRPNLARLHQLLTVADPLETDDITETTLNDG